MAMAKQYRIIGFHFLAAAFVWAAVELTTGRVFPAGLAMAVCGCMAFAVGIALDAVDGGHG